MDTHFFERTLRGGLFAVLLACAGAGAGEDSLDAVLNASPVKGGLCVLAGPADATLAARLARDRHFVVNVLATKADGVPAARSKLLQENLYGCVSVEEWSGNTLSYAENVVSILILLEKTALAESEALRALRPGGQLLVKDGATFRSTFKPRPSGMDEWNQWRHGADRNAVSKDLLVEVPQRIQWLSIQGKEGKETKEMVTASGRCFYISSKTLLARDAFNGVPLWSAPIDAKSTAVASGENVFVQSKGELRCLDAATGQLRRIG